MTVGWVILNLLLEGEIFDGESWTIATKRVFGDAYVSGRFLAEKQVLYFN
jgi:hypothetical protein